MQSKHQKITQHETQSGTNNENSLRQIFNTALVTSRFQSAKEASTEILQLVNSPAFEILLSAVDALAKKEQISQAKAAEKLIATFRNLDQAWASHLMQEGFRNVNRSH